MKIKNIFIWFKSIEMITKDIWRINNYYNLIFNTLKKTMWQFTKNKNLKIILWILFFIIILQQSYAIYLDVYNFKQLEKAKPILESISIDSEKFYYLNEFNDKYNANVKPVKNCYSVWTNNGNEKYRFSFKLESVLYMYIYKTRYFTYPRYDLPIESAWCVMWQGCTTNKDTIISIISNPCR